MARAFVGLEADPAQGTEEACHVLPFLEANGDRQRVGMVEEKRGTEAPAGLERERRL